MLAKFGIRPTRKINQKFFSRKQLKKSNELKRNRSESIFEQAQLLMQGGVNTPVRAFNKVENSLQYLVRSWPIIVEFISVQRRLSDFESKLDRASLEQEKI